MADVLYMSIKDYAKHVSASVGTIYDMCRKGKLPAVKIGGWRINVKRNIMLAMQTGVNLDLRGAQQIYDSASGKYKVGNVKCVVRGVPKKTELGKLDVGTTTGTANTIETAYIKVTIDGETVLELDKFNYICNIGGVDYMADVREALGMV